MGEERGGDDMYVTETRPARTTAGLDDSHDNFHIYFVRREAERQKVTPSLDGYCVWISGFPLCY